MTDNKVCKVAYEAHMQGNTGIEVLLEPAQAEYLKNMQTTDFSISANKLTFSSLELKNQYIAKYIFDKNKKTLSDPIKWFSIAGDIWIKEISNHEGISDKAAGHLLALVHEEHDVLIALSNILKTTTDDAYPFIKAFSYALPYIKNISASSIIKLFGTEYEGSHLDLYSARSAIQPHLEKSHSLCKEVRSGFIDILTEENNALYTITTLILAKQTPQETTDQVIYELDSTNDILKNAALWALSRLYEEEYLPDNSKPKATDLILEYSTSANTDTYKTAINAMSTLLYKTDKFDDRLIELGQADQLVLSRISHEIWLKHEGIKPQNRLAGLLFPLSSLSPENQEGIRNFSHALSSLLKNDDNEQLVIDTLSHWIISQTDKNEQKAKNQINNFDGLFFEIANQEKLLSKIITDWFLSENRQLLIACSTCLSVLWVHGIKAPRFFKQKLEELDLPDIKLLIRHMLGFITSEDHLLSLSLSLLDVSNAPEQMFGIVRSLLVDEIGQDFPTSVITRLEDKKEIATDETWINFYDDVIDAIKAPLDALDELPSLPELKPSFELQRKFSLARSKSMDEAIDESRDNNSLSSLFTTIPIKAGAGWFQYSQGGYSEPSYMQEHSHSITIPRRDSTDEVGSILRRFHFRLAKRGEE